MFKEPNEISPEAQRKYREGDTGAARGLDREKHLNSAGAGHGKLGGQGEGVNTSCWDGAEDKKNLYSAQACCMVWKR